VDWLARGGPREGEEAGETRAGDLARDDVVATCDLDARVGDVRERVEASPYGFALVLGPGRTLLGRLRRAVLEGDPDALAQDVMEPGPSTIRPNRSLDSVRERMARLDLRTLPVTTPEGSLLGVVRREDVG
jgi:CBS domain-containing protein